MTGSPAFLFYVNEFLGSFKVARMDATEIGVYVMLLILDWQEDGFDFAPTSDELQHKFDRTSLAHWCRVDPRTFDRAWRIVHECFEDRGGRMFNKRLDMERQRQRDWRAKSSKGGSASASVRAKHRATTVEPPFNLSLSFPYPKPNTTPTAPSYPEEFERTWVEYPKRSGPNNKRAAFKAWSARIRDGANPEDIHAGVLRYAAYCEARGSVGGDYVKMASTFFGPDLHYAEPWEAGADGREPDLEIEE